jgi:hypothetical protein
MPQFIDFHEDLKLPAETIAQIAADTRNGRADQFGVRQAELHHNPDGTVYCLLEGPGRGRHPPAPRRPRRSLRRHTPGKRPHLTGHGSTVLKIRSVCTMMAQRGFGAGAGCRG